MAGCIYVNIFAKLSYLYQKTYIMQHKFVTVHHKTARKSAHIIFYFLGYLERNMS